MLVRTALFPVRLTWGLGRLSARAGYVAGRASAAGAHRAGQRVGYGRLLAFGAGVGLGLLVAPSSGAQLRDRLRASAERRRAAGGDHEVADRVRQALADSPRTWHLPQPEVDVVAGIAVLTGTVPHDAGRRDIERAAAGVQGVAGVDNRLAVGPLPEPEG